MHFTYNMFYNLTTMYMYITSNFTHLKNFSMTNTYCVYTVLRYS